MKAKDIASQLGNLAAATGNGYGYGYDSGNIDMDIPEELHDPDPLFTVEHEQIIDTNEIKAKQSIKQIVNSIVPEAYQDNPIIKDKIEQDAQQLGQLYYQQSMNNVMIKTIMDTIAKGDTTAKLFDSYTKLMSIAKDLNKQINEMQNQFRKYYIDTYMDLQHKDDEDLILQADMGGRQKRVTGKKQIKALTYHESSEEDLERRETSTRDTVMKIQDWKKEQFKKQFEEQKNKESE